jgi:hypothetical protein
MVPEIGHVSTRWPLFAENATQRNATQRKAKMNGMKCEGAKCDAMYEQVTTNK